MFANMCGAWLSKFCSGTQVQTSNLLSCFSSDVPDMSCEEVASVVLQGKGSSEPLIIIDTRTQEEQQVHECREWQQLPSSPDSLQQLMNFPFLPVSVTL
eukprot:scaffold6302_cov14-Tisochrysis_lutea.AAC.1